MTHAENKIYRAFTIMSDDLEHALKNYPYASTAGLLAPFAQFYYRNHVPELYELMHAFNSNVIPERLETSRKLLDAFERAYVTCVTDHDQTLPSLRLEFEKDLHGPGRKKLMRFLSLFASHEEHQQSIAGILARITALILEDGQYQPKPIERVLSQYRNRLLKSSAYELSHHPFPVYDESTKRGEWIACPNNDLHEEILNAFLQRLEKMGFSLDQSYMLLYSWTRHGLGPIMEAFTKHMSRISYPIYVDQHEATWCRITQDKDLITLNCVLPFRRSTLFKHEEKPLVSALRIEHILTEDSGSIKPLMPGTLISKSFMLTYEAYTPAGWVELPANLSLLESKEVAQKERLYAPFSELKTLLGFHKVKTSPLMLPELPPYNTRADGLQHIQEDEEEKDSNKDASSNDVAQAT